MNSFGRTETPVHNLWTRISLFGRYTTAPYSHNWGLGVTSIWAAFFGTGDFFAFCGFYHSLVLIKEKREGRHDCDCDIRLVILVQADLIPMFEKFELGAVTVLVFPLTCFLFSFFACPRMPTWNSPLMPGNAGWNEIVLTYFWMTCCWMLPEVDSGCLLTTR